VRLPPLRVYEAWGTRSTPTCVFARRPRHGPDGGAPRRTHVLHAHDAL
jgi:hypothetical protein